MQTVAVSTLQWSKRVESTSSVRDALGLWSHLNIQTDFTPGITSVTDRIRYYTNLAWYWKHLYGKFRAEDFEKIFILKCLSHHDGNSNSPYLSNVFNKTRFDGKWQSIDIFDLSFNIQGFGRSYYSTQLVIFRCAWTDFLGNIQLSSINDKLASCLSELNANDFLHQTFTHDFLNNNFKGFCICDSEINAKEIDIMFKLFFGFFSLQNGAWDIDEGEFQDFLKGQIELEFEKQDPSISHEIDLENNARIHRMNLHRRNTLFLFLRAINETNPDLKELRRTLWDAIYFSQNRKTKQNIDFGRFERVRLYWEYFQLNVYYVYSLEMILNAIQLVVRKHNGIQRTGIINVLKEEYFYDSIDKMIDCSCKNYTIAELLNKVWEKNSRY